MVGIMHANFVAEQLKSVEEHFLGKTVEKEKCATNYKVKIPSILLLTKMARIDLQRTS